MKSDTELLDFILCYLSIREKSNNEKELDWPFSDMVGGLKDAGADPDMVDELISRKLKNQKD